MWVISNIHVAEHEYLTLHIRDIRHSFDIGQVIVTSSFPLIFENFDKRFFVVVKLFLIKHFACFICHYVE
jgi:hypothetical protein